jgi:hypothetical protein
MTSANHLEALRRRTQRDQEHADLRDDLETAADLIGGGTAGEEPRP